MIFDITIDGTAFAANSAPNDGFFEPSDTFDSAWPSTRAIAIAKGRGYRRYKLLTMMLTNLGLTAMSHTVTGGDDDTAPSSIDLTVTVVNAHTDDEENAGQTLSGVDAIKRVVARALLVNESYNFEIFDPTDITIVQNGANKTVKKGITLETFAVGPIAASLAAAEGAITVTTA